MALSKSDPDCCRRNATAALVQLVYENAVFMRSRGNQLDTGRLAKSSVQGLAQPYRCRRYRLDLRVLDSECSAWTSSSGPVRIGCAKQPMRLQLVIATQAQGSLQVGKA